MTKEMMLTLNFEALITILGILLANVVWSQYRHDKKRSLTLILAILSISIVYFLDTVFILTKIALSGTAENIIVRVCIFGESLAGYGLSFFLSLYIIIVIEKNKTVSKIFKTIVLVMVVMPMLLLIYTQFSGALYYFDESNAMVSGWAAPFDFFLTIINTIIIFSMTVFYRKNLSKRDFRSLLFYCITIALSIIGNLKANSIDIVFTAALISLFIVAIANNAEISEALLRTRMIERDLTTATEIQTHSLPQVFPPFENHKDIDLYASMKAAKSVGGDFYDCFEIDASHVCIVIGDVSGKGIPAALFMMQAKTLIQSNAFVNLDVGQIATQVNSLLTKDNPVCMFVTTWIGILDTEHMVLDYVNAGHNPPCFFANEGDGRFLKKIHGPALGMLDGVEYEYSQKKLNKGDFIYLYTDGVTEANNENGEMLGEENLILALSEMKGKSSQEIVESILNKIKLFAGEADQFDDITMLCMRV